jgi:hypothetical protein
MEDLWNSFHLKNTYTDEREGATDRRAHAHRQDNMTLTHKQAEVQQNNLVHKKFHWHWEVSCWHLQTANFKHLILLLSCWENKGTCRASIFETAIAPTYGRLSITASAKSEMNVGSHPSAGTRPHFSIPDLRANSLYSTSISSKVSICSLTKLRISVQNFENFNA